MLLARSMGVAAYCHRTRRSHEHIQNLLLAIGLVQAKARPYTGTWKEVISHMRQRDDVGWASGLEQIHPSVGKSAPMFAFEKIPA